MFTPGSAGGRSVLVWEGPAALKAAGAQVGAGQWCDTVGPVVVSYHTGKSSSGLPGEMTRQLDGQFTALSLMSAKEILAGMATFDERKRSPVSHTRIRKDFQKKLAKNLWERHKFPKDVAGLWASRAMRELAVLHNPDQLLAGPQGPSLVGGAVALGDRVTNSAVGSQTAQGPRELIRAAAQAAVDAGQGDRLLRMRVVLTDSPDLSRGLNRGLEALEPRSLAEREAVSPRGPPLTVQVLSDRLAQVPGGPDGLEDLTRDELRQALTQPPGQTPDHPDTPTPDGPGTDAPDRLDAGTPGMGAPETGAPGLDTAGLDRGAPEMGAPSTGSPAKQAPVSAPVAGQPVPGPVEQVARPTDSSPSMSAPTPDLNAPDRALLTGALPSRPPLSRARQTGWPQRRAPLSRPDQTRPPQVRAHPMRVCLVRLVGVLLMGALRVGLPRRRRLGSGGPRRLLRRRCLRSRRWCRPAHSGLPRPRPPNNQVSRADRPIRTSQANRDNRFSRVSRADRASRVSRFSLVGRPSRVSLFRLVSLVCRVGVLLGRVPRGLTPGLRPPRVCRPAKRQERLLPRPVQGPRPGPAPQPGRHSRRPSAAPAGAPLGTHPAAPLGTPQVAVLGTLPVAVLVGAVPTPRPGQRRGPRPVRSRARPVPPPPAHARRPRTRSRPSWPLPVTPSETPS
ncbi:polymorphic toxin type 15 domain-containing protein [Actinomyces oris]|uniref:polymorphic toxin type 15 domain-containing protein n=1 Tax=Actinomyces oris TaxID=544580 RepID=UPI0011780899